MRHKSTNGLCFSVIIPSQGTGDRLVSEKVTKSHSPPTLLTSGCKNSHHRLSFAVEAIKMYELDKNKFGAFVARLRKEKGFTQKELAEQLLISDKAVSKWETGVSHS